MTVQVLLRLEFFLAHWTLKPRVLHSVLVVFVEVEGQLIGQRTAAHVADTRVVLVRDEMLGVISLNSKLSVALLAREVKVVRVFAHEVHLQNILVRYRLVYYR